MSEETELESIETNLKNKLNNAVKNNLIKNRDFQECLSIDEKIAIVYRIRINKKQYYIRFSTHFLTEVSAFTRSKNAKVYTSLKDKVKVNEREYNFVMFLFLLKMRETETTEMVDPEPLRDDVSLFDRQQTAFDSFKLSYPDKKVNIRDDVILEVPQVVVCGKLLTIEQYVAKPKKDSSCAMMGGKTKRKSKKRMIKRKSKKRIIKRKSKKRIIKRKSKKRMIK
jgi:hypothetical protein